MKKLKAVKCGYCKKDITSETCKLAAYRTIIDGREYSFCCASCAGQKTNAEK